MDTVLIVGLDSVVGSNLALSLTGRYSVVGLWQRDEISLKDCPASGCPDDNGGTARNWIATIRPHWIVYCGPAAQTAWQGSLPSGGEGQTVEGARNWADAARTFDCRFTMISTDAVFTGPWLFHPETSRSYCQTPQARALRAAERAVIDHCPDALIVRSHAFGWSPGRISGSGWVDARLDQLELANGPCADTSRHATPILATDLAVVLERAYQAGLSGVYHVGGSERVNPHEFVRRLADQFQLPPPVAPKPGSCVDWPAGFGEGETSLRCRKIRKALGITLPMLDEGLARLYDQQYNGHRDRLLSDAEPVREKVA